MRQYPRDDVARAPRPPSECKLREDLWVLRSRPDINLGHGAVRRRSILGMGYQLDATISRWVSHTQIVPRADTQGRVGAYIAQC